MRSVKRRSSSLKPFARQNLPSKKVNEMRRISLKFCGTASGQVSLAWIDGKRVNGEGQNGKVVVLAIGASWLLVSGKQAEFTNSLAKKYAGKNVVFYFVATDSANPKSKNFATDDAVKK